MIPLARQEYPWTNAVVADKGFASQAQDGSSHSSQAGLCTLPVIRLRPDNRPDNQVPSFQVHEA